MVYWSDYRPSLSLVRDSLRKRSREYVRENSLHVVPYFIDPSRSIYERLMWFVIFNMSAIAAVATIMTIWQKFQTSPTLTYLHIERENSSVDFPSIYLCFDESHLNFSKLPLTPKQVEILQSLYRWKGDLELGNEDVGVVGYKRYFLEVSPECGQFFSDCEFGDDAFNCDDLFTRKIATPDGVCCEYKSRPVEKDDTSWSLRFRPSQYPISVHIGGKHEGPPLYGQQPIYQMISFTSIELSLTITSTASSIRFLTRHQRKCVFPDESPSHVDCERTYIKKVMKSRCDCLPWFYADNQLDECSLANYHCLSSTDTKQIPTRNCYMPCEHTAYTCEKIERGPMSQADDDTSPCEIKFADWPDVRFRRATRFGWLDLVVSFGGVAGSFIGYSIITSVEWFYYFTLRTYCGAVLSKPKTRYNVQQPAKRVPRDPPIVVKEKVQVHASEISADLRKRYVLSHHLAAWR